MTSSRRDAGIRNIPPPPDSRAGNPYARFIPREELQDFASWTPGAFSGAVRPEPPLPMADFARGEGQGDGADTDLLLDDDDAADNAAYATPPYPTRREATSAPQAAQAAEATRMAARQAAQDAADDAAAAELEALQADLAAEYERRLATETAAAAQAARHQGYQDGYRDGLVALESFKESHARQLSGQIGLLVRAFDTELSALEQQLAGSVARVATELARQVVRSELAIRPALVAQVAQEAMAAVLQSARHITVQVHPDDHALVAQGCEEALGARGARLQAQAGVARGGCRVESDAGTIDACVAARWAQATQALGTGLGWSDHDAPGADA